MCVRIQINLTSHLNSSHIQSHISTHISFNLTSHISFNLYDVTSERSIKSSHEIDLHILFLFLFLNRFELLCLIFNNNLISIHFHESDSSYLYNLS